MKPPEYRNTYIVQQITPYRIATPTPSADSVPLCGLLDVGRVLWMTCEPCASGLSVIVYAHGIGLLEIERSLLRSSLGTRKPELPPATRGT